MIKDIDNFASSELSVPVKVLMDRSGEAIAAAVRSLRDIGERVIVLCGGGNNGADGYAAALKLFRECEVLVYDVLCKGQRSDEGKCFLEEFKKIGGKILRGIPHEETFSEPCVVIDAIFGTGFCGVVPDELINLARYINSRTSVRVVAADIPLGISADDGCAADFALRADITVALSFPKLAMFSYPAKEYVGRVEVDSLGLDENIISQKFEFKNYFLDFSLAKTLLPKRADNSNKGSFGHCVLIVGSSEYAGAAMLALESALRGGAGYTTFIGEDSLCDSMLAKFPEAIYKRSSIRDYDTVWNYTENQDAILIGSGCGCSEPLYTLVKKLVFSEGAPLVIDADAINSVARYGTPDIFKEAKRRIIITPHPLEFSRISRVGIDLVNRDRYGLAKTFANEYRCVVLLKGAATVITDGETTYVNGSGSSALAKAGSGDVLAGLLTSILAYKKSALESAALAAYIHGKCADKLSSEYSSYGVTPSDIPKMVAKIMAEIERGG